MSEQSTVITLHHINRLGLLTDMERVYWAVRNEYLNLIRVKLYSKYPVVITINCIKITHLSQLNVYCYKLNQYMHTIVLDLQ